MKISLMCGLWQSIVDFITGFFALIPQFIYFIYTCCASILDFFQYLIRKLIGLDVYYINTEEQQGDIVLQFIKGVLGINKDPAYSAISTVFWSLVIFGVIVLVVSTIFSVIKNQYNYDKEKSQPMKIVFESIKSLSLMAIIPVVCIFGITLSNIFLGALDTITTSSSTAQISETFETSSVKHEDFFEKGKTKNGYETYSSYDFFGAKAYTNMQTFSGVLFEVSCHSANRVRSGSYEASKQTTAGDGFLWSDFGIFTSDVENKVEREENVASMIDYAFAHNLQAKEKQTASVLGKDSVVLTSSFLYLQSAVWYFGLINFDNFSKYNVGLVWYYYNLWAFNFFLAFAGIIVCLTIFTNIIFGLSLRLFELLGLFMVFPTLIGITPLDDRRAIKDWNGKFLGNILMAYGAVAGLNISFLIMKEVENIIFFSSAILNNIVSMIIIMTVLLVIKDFIKLVSGFIKAEDSNTAGQGVKSTLAEPMKKTVKAGLKAAQIAAKVLPAGSVVAMAASTLAKSRIMAKQAMINHEFSDVNDLRKDEKTKKAQLEIAQQELSDKSGDMQEFFESAKGDEGSAANVTAGRAKAVDAGMSADFYDDFVEKLDVSNNIIDSSGMSDEEKTKAKEKARQELVQETMEEVSRSSTHRDPIDDAQEGLNNTQEQIKARLEEKKKKEEEVFNPKKEKTGMRKKLADIKGTTFKFVGSVTGTTANWKALKKAGIVDEMNMVVQNIFQAFGPEKQRRKIADGTSKFITEKQKTKNKEFEAKQKSKALREESRLNNVMLGQMKNFVYEHRREMERQNTFTADTVIDRTDTGDETRRVEEIKKALKKTIGKEFEYSSMAEINKLAKKLGNPRIIKLYSDYARGFVRKCEMISQDKILTQDLKQKQIIQHHEKMVKNLIRLWKTSQ